jgi:SlyX protein
MRDRLTEIEIKIAHMEQAVNELSDVLYHQQQLIERLETGLEKLAENLASAGEGPTQTDAADQKPPHY